jgi:hypothetical protein
VAIWRRLKLTARGDPDHDHVVAQIVARLTGPPRRAVVLAGDETHLNLLPHVRVSWTLSFGSPFSSTARQPRPQKGPADREPGASPGPPACPPPGILGHQDHLRGRRSAHRTIRGIGSD